MSSMSTHRYSASDIGKTVELILMDIVMLNLLVVVNYCT